MPLDEEEVKEHEQQRESSSATTLERRYGLLRPAAVGMLAKVRKEKRREPSRPPLFSLPLQEKKRGVPVALLKLSSEKPN
jgi:hypothetical protein